MGEELNCNGGGRSVLKAPHSKASRASSKTAQALIAKPLHREILFDAKIPPPGRIGSNPSASGFSKKVWDACK
jgi:hypothetical protein